MYIFLKQNGIALLALLISIINVVWNIGRDRKKDKAEANKTKKANLVVTAVSGQWRGTWRITHLNIANLGMAEAVDIEMSVDGGKVKQCPSRVGPGGEREFDIISIGRLVVTWNDESKIPGVFSLDI